MWKLLLKRGDERGVLLRMSRWEKEREGERGEGKVEEGQIGLLLRKSVSSSILCE